MPKVSIIMGVFNVSKFVEEAIRSIVEQTYNDWEFIICNDGSTDETASIVKKWAKKDKRIVFIENVENMGLGFSLNRCIEIAKGEYLVRMDGDDISNENRIGKLIETAFLNPNYTVIGSGMILFDEKGEWGKTKPIEFPNKMQIFKGPAVTHATTIMKTQIIRKVGGYNPACDSCRIEDYDLWCRLAENNYLIMSIPDLLYKCRWDQVSYYKRRKISYLIGFAKLKLFWANRLELGLKGQIHSGIIFIKAFVPSFIKRFYHKQKLSNEKVA